MKNRLHSYGYGMKDGQIIIIEQEAKIVRTVFERYIAGETLKGIADSLVEKGIEYYTGCTNWNKTTIMRMIENKKYIGDKGYPLILDLSVFEQANEIKNGKSFEMEEQSPAILQLKKIVYCRQCGEKIVRRSKWKNREKWYCANGCKIDRYTDDKIIFQALMSLNKSIVDDPAIIEVSIEQSNYSRTQEILRYTNEIRRMTEAKEPSFQSIKRLILECANLKFQACNENKSDSYGSFLIEKSMELAKKQEIDEDYLKACVEKILIEKDGSISTIYINGKELCYKGG